MDEMAELRAEVAALSQRLRALEDHVAITQAVARYGPSVDSGSAEAAASLWTEDGVFDVPPFATWTGREEIAGMVRGDGHQSLIHNGCGHVLTVPYITVEGDRARGWNYALNIRYDHDADRFWIGRLSANTWEWSRTPEGWKVTTRVNHNLDGSSRPRDMFEGATGA